MKRSLAVACGRAGRPDIVRHYAAELLPRPEHRLINLRYHLEYYGSLRRAVEAVVSHVLSGGYNFLQPIDLFTLRQVMAAEPPLGPPDEAVAEALTALLRRPAATSSWSRASALPGCIPSSAPSTRPPVRRTRPPVRRTRWRDDRAWTSTSLYGFTAGSTT